MGNEKKAKLSSLDTGIAISSGMLTAAMDFLWVKDINLEAALSWGKDHKNEFDHNLSMIAEGKSQNTAITRRENLELSPMGLVDAIRDMRDYAISPNENSNSGLSDSILWGTIHWTMNVLPKVYKTGEKKVSSLVSKLGIPSELLSVLQKIAEMQNSEKLSQCLSFFDTKSGNLKGNAVCSAIIKNVKDAVSQSLCEDSESGNESIKFDLSTQLGLVSQTIFTKQYLPVALNILFVSAFYSVSRFIKLVNETEISNPSELIELIKNGCLPWGNPEINAIRKLASVTFSSVDIISAGVKSFGKNRGNSKQFVVDLFLGVNYWGLGTCVLQPNTQFMINAEGLYQDFAQFINSTREKIKNCAPSAEEWENIAKESTSVIMAIEKAGGASPMGMVGLAMSTYQKIMDSYAEYNEAVVNRIEVEEACQENIKIIRENRQILSSAIGEYLAFRLEVFGSLLDVMGDALRNEETDTFIEANSELQNILGHDSQFRDTEEFDLLMESDDVFKL